MRRPASGRPVSREGGTPASVSVYGLPPAGAPFPVEVPVRMRADLTPLAGEPLARGPDDDALLAAKRDALRVRADRIRGLDPERPLAAAATDIAATLPALARLRPDVVRPAGAAEDGALLGPGRGRAWLFPRLGGEAHDLLRRSPEPLRLADALALSLPEDLVWMRDDGAAGRASLLHVAFPSRWAPERRGGASLTELHGPVADGERLRAASAALMRAMVHKGPFERHVWSLASSPALDLHPRATARNLAAPRDPATDPLASTWWRVERQTTLPFPEAGLGLFAIRVRIARLDAVLAARPGRAARLAAALRSMSDAVRAYRGVADPAPLLDALDAVACEEDDVTAPAPAARRSRRR